MSSSLRHVNLQSTNLQGVL
ncbi:hypothetical protein MTR67_053620 [Solanum verrucosum]|uniref:Uncharacterized protein n=1 Tax=Solanum verrucosum TaxID=315347 RepID=A0AAF0V7X6_SOLVR|nr:hypothetical protein MTR67_053620 [Solanum verrucosum]